VAEKDPHQARPQLSACDTAIDELPDPSTRIVPRMRIAEGYARLKDIPRATEAFRKALVDVRPLWTADTRAERLNTAPRDTWPSIQACRLLMYHAAKTLGPEAATLLADIQVPDLALVARIHFATALLGLPPDIQAINVAWTSKE